MPQQDSEALQTRQQAPAHDAHPASNKSVLQGGRGGNGRSLGAGDDARHALDLGSFLAAACSAACSSSSKRDGASSTKQGYNTSKVEVQQCPCEERGACQPTHCGCRGPAKPWMCCAGMDVYHTQMEWKEGLK